MGKSIIYIGLVFVFSLLIGCQSPPHSKEVTNAPYLPVHTTPKPFNPLFFHNQTIEKLSLPSGQFSGAAEWLDGETILYIKESGTQSEVWTFNLFTGETALFYESEAPVYSVSANDDYELFAIYTSPSYTEGKLSIINKDGKLITEWVFPDTSSMEFSWDPYTGQRLMASSFKEDWSFESFLLDVPSQSMVKKTVDNPFVQWLDKEKLGYINWNPDMPTLTAPLYALDLASQTVDKLMGNLLLFNAYQDLLVTLSTDEEESQTVAYTFYSLPGMNAVESYEAPLLALYSNYFIPYYEYVKAAELFYTFEPASGGSYDGYTGDFMLISFDVANGEKKMVMEGMENRPIKCSPNGYYCLYGFQLEQLIIFDSKQTVEFVEFF